MRPVLCCAEVPALGRVDSPVIDRRHFCASVENAVYGSLLAESCQPAPDGRTRLPSKPSPRSATDRSPPLDPALQSREFGRLSKAHERFWLPIKAALRGSPDQMSRLLAECLGHGARIWSWYQNKCNVTVDCPAVSCDETVEARSTTPTQLSGEIACAMAPAVSFAAEAAVRCSSCRGPRLNAPDFIVRAHWCAVEAPQPNLAGYGLGVEQVHVAIRPAGRTVNHPRDALQRKLIARESTLGA